MALVMTMQKWSINLSKQGAQELEIQDSAKYIDMYKKYSNETHYKANHCPQKCVFVAVHELEEEPKALDR